jgi:hypothetical protein
MLFSRLPAGWPLLATPTLPVQLVVLLAEMCLPLNADEVLEWVERDINFSSKARRVARRRAYKEARELRHMQRNLDSHTRYLRRWDLRWMRRVARAAAAQDAEVST